MSSGKQLSQREFTALLSFLNDENQRTVSLVHTQIKAALRVHPDFHNVVKKVRDPQIRKQAELVAEGMWFDELEPKFRALLRKGPTLDLEQAAYLLATISYPHLQPGDICGPLDAMAGNVDRMIVAEPALPTRPLHALRRYLFDIQNFRKSENSHDADSAFINRVLETHVGNPIALSCVYLLVSWRLGLLVHGIGLPGHFIVGHRIPRGVVHIDPSQHGRILRKKDCEVLVRNLGTTFKEEHLDPVSNRQILARMTANLINITSERGEHARAYWLARLYRLVEE